MSCKSILFLTSFNARGYACKTSPSPSPGSDAVVDITLEGLWKSEWLLPGALPTLCSRSRCCRRRRSKAEMHMRIQWMHVSSDRRGLGVGRWAEVDCCSVIVALK